MKEEKDDQKIGKSKGRIIKITILLILIMLLILFFLTKCTGNKNGYSDERDLETTEDMQQTSEDEQESTEEAVALGDSELNSEDTEDVGSEDTATEDENTEEYTAVDTETFVPSDSDMDEYDNSSPAETTIETTTESSDDTTQHQHNWVAQYTTVHHEEEGHYEDVLVQEAYDEPVYEVHYICHYCWIDITASDLSVGAHCTTCGPPMNEDDPFWEEGATEGSSYGTKKVQVDTIHHDAVYETQWIVDKAAYDEKVLTGYTCTCGATKSN